MDLKAAKRVHLQTTLTPINMRRRSEDGRTLFAIGRPVTERAAELRQLALSTADVRALAAELKGAARNVLDALGSSDPLALTRVLAATDERDSKTVLRDGARLKVNRILENAAKLQRQVAEAEDAWASEEATQISSQLVEEELEHAQRFRRIQRLLPRVSATERDRVVDKLRAGRGADADKEIVALERQYRFEPPPQEIATGREARQGALRDRAALILKRHLTSRGSELAPRAQALVSSAAVPMAQRSAIGETLGALGLSAKSVTLAAELEGVLQVVPGLQALAEEIDTPDTGAELTSPIGYLHLERLSYSPSDVQHGELVYSLPLGPGEEVAIVHKEWSNTEEEFQKLVTDQFEDYSERGVVDKIDMAQASSAQHSHSTQFNVAASASGGYGPVTVAASTSFSASNSESSSRQESASRSQTLTKKASSRARKEHRVSFRLAKKTHVEDQTVRKMKNPDPMHPARYDYYQLLRRWRVDLHRYGVRLTYDLTIPQPASDLLKVYEEIESLDNQIEKGFSFTEQAVTRLNWRNLAEKYGVILEPPPPPVVAVQSAKVVPPFPEEDPYDDHCDELRVACPEGYVFQSWDGSSYYYHHKTEDVFPGVEISRMHSGKSPIPELVFGVYLDSVKTAVASVRVWFDVMPETEDRWSAASYAAIREAANKAYLEKRQILEARRAQLLAKLESMDALTLRKLEREEIMKGVLRWLFGPDMDFAPNVNGPFYDYTGIVWSHATQVTVLAFGQVVSFLHTAIEWESINYFLYPYFWTNKSTWPLRQRLHHPDAIHEAFLRAGACRVVLPVRRGWERAFLNFLAAGNIADTLPGDHPYMTVAEELENFAQTNYPGIVPANPETADPQTATDIAEGVLVTSWYEYTPTGAFDIKLGETVPSEACSRTRRSLRQRPSPAISAPRSRLWSARSPSASRRDLVSYKIFPAFGFSGSGTVMDIKSGKDPDRSLELTASTLSRMAKNLYPESNVFPAFKSWTCRDLLTRLTSIGTIGEIHVCTHGGSSLLSLAFEFEGGKRIRRRAKKFNMRARKLGPKAAGIQALDEEDGLWTGTLSVFPSDPDNWRKRAVDLIKPALAAKGYIHIWGCYAGATTASFEYAGDADLGPYFRRFRLRPENPGVARDIAMALKRPVTAAQVLPDKKEGGLSFWVRRDNGKIERASDKENPKAPFWLWPDKNAKWVTFKPDGSESNKVRIWSTERDPNEVASGKPPKWFTNTYR